MSDAEAKNIAGKGWSDKERLVYLLALVETSGVKFDFNSTPRPVGCTAIACQRMIDRLKNTFKTELEALKNEEPIQEQATTPKKSPMKRKTKAEGEANGTQTKRGRKKKVEVEAEAETEADVEVKNEEGEENGVKIKNEMDPDEDIEYDMEV